MSNKKKSLLKDHFDQLKTLVPEVYSKQYDKNAEVEKLYQLLKKSLTIVETVYLQNQDRFNPSSIEEYGKVIYDMELMGYDYEGNDELLGAATAQILMGSKKPMKKAGNRNKRNDSNDEKKAI